MRQIQREADRRGGGGGEREREEKGGEEKGGEGKMEGERKKEAEV